MRNYLILSMCVLFLIQYFVQNVWIGYMVVVLAILAFIVSAMNASGFPRVIGIVMMGTGIILELHKGAGVDGISGGILLILPLLCLVTLAPLLSIPLMAHAMQGTSPLAMLLLLCWSISSASSPFSGLNLMVSRIVGISGVETGIRANGLHQSIVAVIGLGIIFFIS